MERRRFVNGILYLALNDRYSRVCVYIIYNIITSDIERVLMIKGYILANSAKE